jgi:hypothetical protein
MFLGYGCSIYGREANILNKQLQTSNNRWSSSLGVGLGTTPHHKKSACYDKTENPKVSTLGQNKIYAYNNKHSLRSNIKGYGGKTH